MTNKMAWWIGLAIASGCKIESFGPGGASVRVMRGGLMLGCGQHGHVEDSLIHAVAQFVGGCGEPVREGWDHPDCRTSGVCGTYGERCRLAGENYEHDGLGAWMHPSEPNPDAYGDALVIEQTLLGGWVSVRLEVTRPGSASPDGHAELRAYWKSGSGADYPAALAAALAADEVLYMITQYKKEGGD